MREEDKGKGSGSGARSGLDPNGRRLNDLVQHVPRVRLVCAVVIYLRTSSPPTRARVGRLREASTHVHEQQNAREWAGGCERISQLLRRPKLDSGVSVSDGGANTASPATTSRRARARVTPGAFRHSIQPFRVAER